MTSPPTHSWEALHRLWHIAPFCALFALGANIFWPAVLGWPLVALVVLNTVAGFYLSFRSLHYVPHALAQVWLVLSFALPMMVVMLPFVVVSVTNAPSLLKPWVAVSALASCVALMVAGAVWYAPKDWGSERPWLRLHTHKALFRMFQQRQLALNHPNWNGAAYAVLGVIALAQLAGLLFLDYIELAARFVGFLLFGSCALIFSILLFATGRVLAALWHVWRIERAEGQRFILGNIEELHAQRRAHGLGRWLTPAALTLAAAYQLPRRRGKRLGPRGAAPGRRAKKPALACGGRRNNPL